MGIANTCHILDLVFIVLYHVDDTHYSVCKTTIQFVFSSQFSQMIV